MVIMPFFYFKRNTFPPPPFNGLSASSAMCQQNWLLNMILHHKLVCGSVELYFVLAHFIQ